MLSHYPAQRNVNVDGVFDMGKKSGDETFNTLIKADAKRCAAYLQDVKQLP